MRLYVGVFADGKKGLKRGYLAYRLGDKRRGWGGWTRIFCFIGAGLQMFGIAVATNALGAFFCRRGLERTSADTTHNEVKTYHDFGVVVGVGCYLLCGWWRRKSAGIRFDPHMVKVMACITLTTAMRPLISSIRKLGARVPIKNPRKSALSACLPLTAS